MTPKAIISRFLSEQFSSEALAVLRADAVAGRVPYDDPRSCLVGHADGGFSLWGLPGTHTASTAYLDLGSHAYWFDPLLPYDRDDKRKMRRLIPIIDAELSRRAAARTEVITHAREAVRCEVAMQARSHRLD